MLTTLLALALLAAPRSVVSINTNKPEHLGQCFTTTVASVHTRLGEGEGENVKNVPGSGSAMDLADGHYMVDYEQLPGIDRSRPGDPVRLCVISLPTHCPKGDTRGIGYGARNLRTGMRWKAGDSQHMCGGA